MKIIGPFVQLLTMRGIALKGAIRDEALEIVVNGGILIHQGKIVEVGNFEELRKQYQKVEVEYIDYPAVCLPAFVDCHTHIAFDGTRSHDFALRNAGSAYLDIAQSGGGIWNTVQATRACALDELTQLTVKRAKKLILQGITTIEVKSGYGLNVEEELKILRAINKANQLLPAEIIPTCLAAHTLSKDFSGSKAAYLQIMKEELFPVLVEEKLTNRMDAFIEQSAFSTEEIKPYFNKAKELGFHITVHADQFTVGGSSIAVEFGAVSADHLEVSGEQEIAKLAQSDVVAVALPGASLGVGCAFTPARKLLDAGASLAIATDWNPGSAPMGQLMTQASILATMEKLTNAEIFSALTFRAAKALSIKNKGRIKEGFFADFQVYDLKDYREITYQQGQLLPNHVYIKGERYL